MLDYEATRKRKMIWLATLFFTVFNPVHSQETSSQESEALMQYRAKVTEDSLKACTDQYIQLLTVYGNNEAAEQHKECIRKSNEHLENVLIPKFKSFSQLKQKYITVCVNDIGNRLVVHKPQKCPTSYSEFLSSQE